MILKWLTFQSAILIIVSSCIYVADTSECQSKLKRQNALQLQIRFPLEKDFAMTSRKDGRGNIACSQPKKAFFEMATRKNLVHEQLYEADANLRHIMSKETF